MGRVMAERFDTEEGVVTRTKSEKKLQKPRLYKVVMHNEAHAAFWRVRKLRTILRQMRHDGCGGRPARAELLTGIDGVSSQPVRRIVLLGGTG